jgi:hypothetical protein
MKIGSKLAILVFTIVAIAHLIRLINGIDVTVGQWNLPQWVSVVAVIGPGIIAGLLWKESK